MYELTHTKQIIQVQYAPASTLAEIISINPFYIRRYGSQMEAGGFEPPSRDALRQASTCLVA